MLRKLRSRKGFTLVELMIVVAIIGILAAIAIPNFLNFRLKAKSSEAKSNLGAIRSTEVAYFAEWNTYVANQDYTPANLAARTGNAGKVTWDTTTRFSILGFAPEGSVFYSYNLEPNSDWPAQSVGFTASALGDLDGDKGLATFQITTASNEVAKLGAPF